MNELNEYVVSKPLLQGIVLILNELPAHVSRKILNQLEFETGQQDREFEMKRTGQHQHQLEAELAAKGWTPPQKV